MRQYKGLYIDNVIFHSTEEIDNFLKTQAIEAYKKAVEIFCFRKTIEASILVDEKAEYLINQFGMDWDEIEAIEIIVMKHAA